MRTGIAVPAGMVTVRKAGGGGGAGSAAGTGAGAGAEGGAWWATSGRSMGAGLAAGFGVAFFGAIGAGAGSGAGAASAAAGGGGCTERLFTTVLIPVTCDASAAASERAASLLTLPFSVTIPFCTEA